MTEFISTKFVKTYITHIWKRIFSKIDLQLDAYFETLYKYKKQKSWLHLCFLDDINQIIF